MARAAAGPKERPRISRNTAGHDGKGRGGAEGKAENLPEYGRVEHGRHTGIEDVVDEVLSPLQVDVLLHRVDEEDQRKYEGEVEGSVAPLLENAEAGRVDVEDRKDDCHGKDQLRRHPRELAEPHLGVVLGDLLDIVFELWGCKNLFLLCHISNPHFNLI